MRHLFLREAGSHGLNCCEQRERIGEDGQESYPHTRATRPIASDGQSDTLLPCAHHLSLCSSRSPWQRPPSRRPQTYRSGPAHLPANPTSPPASRNTTPPSRQTISSPASASRASAMWTRPHSPSIPRRPQRTPEPQSSSSLVAHIGSSPTILKAPR